MQLIKRQFQIFVLVGILTVLIDLAVYRSLLLFWDLPINFAKGCSFLSGTFFAYIANRFWTFQNNDHIVGSVYRFVPLYFLTLVINIAINSLILVNFNYIFLIDYIAFTVATVCSAMLNFLGMKFFVFKSTNT